jgi:hypothetical protein
MEVYRYWTSSRLAEARSLGRIESNYPKTFPRFPRHIFVLPGDPTLWGEDHMNKLIWNVNLNHKSGSRDGLVLLRLSVSENDPNIFIRDLYDWDWFPIATHKPSMFQYPEMIIPTPIPVEEVEELPLPADLNTSPVFTLW